MSISKKISVLFVLSFLLMSIIGFWIDTINSKRIDDLIKQKYLDIANEILLNIDNKNQIEQLLEQYGLKRVSTLANDNEVLYEQKHTFGVISIQKESFEDEFILHINFLDESLILKTPDEQNINDKLQLNALIFLDIFILVVTFAYILKLLYPLKTITKEIENFSHGNLSSRIKITSNDEIGTLAKTFNTMANTLENLITTREALLRDIGHELRTPIAKGKFALEKINDFSQKELLKKIFKDLELLTNELLELEKLNSSKLNLSTFSTETLILEALSKLYIDDESKIQLHIKEDFNITGDLHYLSLALKNIIDNALKYATTLPVTIEVSSHSICVSNHGHALSKELEHYLKPFTQERQERDGFGLGLSIVKKIMDKHQFDLSYEFQKEQNRFTLYFVKKV
jgi:two-component system OmpR family sensor kinase